MIFPRENRVYLFVEQDAQINKLFVADDDAVGTVPKIAYQLRPEIKKWCIDNLTGNADASATAYVRHHNNYNAIQMAWIKKFSIEFVTENDAVLFKTWWL